MTMLQLVLMPVGDFAKGGPLRKSRSKAKTEARESGRQVEAKEYVVLLHHESQILRGSPPCDELC